MSSLASLAARLTESQDRETYAALISHVNALPPGDELFKLVELLGLLSLFGQRIPEASAELLCELRNQARAVSSYRAELDARLAILPGELAAGVDLALISKDLSERFRQQITESGLQDSAALLRGASREIRAVSQDIAAALRPVAMEYKMMAATISRELESLTAAARRLQDENAVLRVDRRQSFWPSMCMAAGLIFLLGVAFATLMVKHG